ncbi:MAG TPA: hypothetical protein VNS81_02660 [Nocardioides sp.]|nr:hypothetical protein [Nocardioides sp.]
MASFVPSDPETLADAERYTQARMVEVECLDCLARVRVKKNSEHHTSIQWSLQAIAACPVMARGNGGSAQASVDRDTHRGCPRLADSIDAAARSGQLPVGAEDGY